MTAELLIVILLFGIFFLLGLKLGRSYPSKYLLMIEYYRGRVDELNNHPDYWEPK